MAASALRIRVIEDDQLVPVPTEAVEYVRNFLARVRNFRFTNRHELLDFARRKKVPPPICDQFQDQVPAGSDVWTFLTSRPREEVKLITHRMQVREASRAGAGVA